MTDNGSDSISVEDSEAPKNGPTLGYLGAQDSGEDESMLNMAPTPKALNSSSPKLNSKRKPGPVLNRQDSTINYYRDTSYGDVFTERTNSSKNLKRLDSQSMDELEQFTAFNYKNVDFLQEDTVLQHKRELSSRMVPVRTSSDNVADMDTDEMYTKASIKFKKDNLVVGNFLDGNGTSGETTH